MKNFVLSFLLLAFFGLVAKGSDNVQYPTVKVDGSLKSKYEYAQATGNSRFSIRSSRIGVKGYLTEHVSYRGQIEISDNGSFKPLDLYAALEPIGGLSISFGQRTIPLFNSYTVIPSDLMFSNRAFLGKYLMGTRDIGMLAQYDFSISTVPASIEFGIYNGNTINDPVWHESPSYGGRLTFGEMKGWRSSYKFYNHTNQKNPDVHYLIYGADLRYQADNWKVETEIMKRNDEALNSDNLLTYYVQGAYAFPLKEHYIFKNIVPAVRWDAIDRNLSSGGFDVNRLTLGLGFGLTKKYFSSILRFDYERYLINNRLDFMHVYPEMDSDKFTVELMLKF